MKKTVASIAVVSALTLPAAGWAKPSFPGQIQQHWALPSAPTCIICHGSTQGGGPVVQPFGQALQAAGLNASGGDSLTQALDQVKAAAHDSNGDGVSDYDALMAGKDPNPDKPPVEYGCGGGQIAPRGGAGWPATALSLLTFAYLAHKSSRRVSKASPKEPLRSPRV